ncbi:MAG: hypothetical protein HC843_01165 [Sphingomonadales bacterium]|nr:hypothetical protein [Sphingomonadales bacterium]
MADQKNVAKHSGFLSRLLRDEAGNTIAIMAAAVIPVIGLIGGSVDMGRIYLVQSRLQAACDAGSLMGRKQMGLGQWADDDYEANKKAQLIFDQNFESGAYGTTDLTKVFTESGGAVNGTASAKVDMTLMKALGQGQRKITVECKSDLRIPNTDVMFVLDTTGSMGDPAPGGSTTKIAGLRTAVKCFYEALAKQNIDDVDPDDCGETEDPRTANAPSASLRFGFVPYSLNVNARDVLPLNALADTWTYQSREAYYKTSTVVGNTPSYGTESTPVETNRSSNTNGGGGWNFTYADITVNGTNYNWLYNSTKTGNCDSYSNPPNSTVNGTSTTTLWSQTPDPVTYPASTVTKTYRTIQSNGTTEYRYTKAIDSRSNYYCALQSKNNGTTTTTIWTQTTTPVTWNVQNISEFAGWKYKPVTFNVSGFKDVNNNAWRSSASFPIGTDGANKTINWSGCIEERQTHRITDSDPSDDWIPTPSDALDMNIDLAPDPSNPATLWGPHLKDMLYIRYGINTDSSGNKSRSSTKTTNEVIVDKDWGITMPTHGGWNVCPTAMRKARTYSTAADVTNFKNYINDLTIGGTTYHDIGLLWGARLISPTGYFAPTTDTIERHVIFMTDGDAVAGAGNSTNSHSDYASFGLHWYDRRQSSTGSAPTAPFLVSNINARTQALCAKIKAMPNTSLWVVSYGGGVNEDNEALLEKCASSGKYIQASSVEDLVREFKGIADNISFLRLTK